MNAPGAGRVADEIDFMRRVVPLDGARVIELGCGNAELSRRLVERGIVRSVVALEVDERQHAANLVSQPPRALRFMPGGAEAIPLPDAQFDLAIMLKSLHHVPLDVLDRALREVRRVLVAGGHLYVSEPVYAGDFNEVVRLFHDEGVVRAAAYRAIRHAVATGVLKSVGEHMFETEVSFRDYDEFVDRIVRVTHSDIRLPDAIAGEVRARFERHMTPAGARFVRQLRVNVLQKA
ncbi:MAG TPA: class I SAM-dependent methyltransferase [Burkholderiaceae bacterium]|nr:class I SAM-dependent methyltransferase [Burkholderiaceae bacterium]